MYNKRPFLISAFDIWFLLFSQLMRPLVSGSDLVDAVDTDSFKGVFTFF